MCFVEKLEYAHKLKIYFVLVCNYPFCIYFYAYTNTHRDICKFKYILFTKYILHKQYDCFPPSIYCSSLSISINIKLHHIFNVTKTCVGTWVTPYLHLCYYLWYLGKIYSSLWVWVILSAKKGIASFMKNCHED